MGGGGKKGRGKKGREKKEGEKKKGEREGKSPSAEGTNRSRN
jgi:hypothetical protein